MLYFRAAVAARKCSFFLGLPNFAEFVPNPKHSALAEYGPRTILVFVPNTFFSLGINVNMKFMGPLIFTT